jgi:hypothetical protein
LHRYLRADLDELPRTVPETDASKVDARELYRQAGVPAPERPIVNRLSKPWKNHRSGAFVVFGDDAVYVFDR